MIKDFLNQTFVLPKRTKSATYSRGYEQGVHDLHDAMHERVAELEAKLAKAMRNQRGKPMDYPDPRPWDGRMIMYTKPSN